MEEKKRYYNASVSKAVQKYKKKNYSQILVYVKKDEKEKIRSRAAAKEKTMNAYIISLIKEDMGEAEGEERVFYLPKIDKHNLGKYIKSFFFDPESVGILAKVIIADADTDTFNALSYLAAVCGRKPEEIVSAYNNLYNDDPIVGEYNREIWLACFEAAGGNREQLDDLIKKSREKAENITAALNRS